MRCRATHVLWLGLALGACTDNGPDESRQGGDTTVDDRTANAFLHPATNLSMADQETWQGGSSPFDFHWEIPQLGPLYNNDSCFGCHGSNGRGRAQIGTDDALVDINGAQSESLVRASLATGDPDPTNPGGPIPVPGFGTQLQDHNTGGVPEVKVTLSWMEQTPVMYADGSTVSLRLPQLDIEPGDTSMPLPDGTLTSYRTAPPLIGIGLLMAVDPTAVQAEEAAGTTGIVGQTNQVWDPVQGATVIGRLGWKCNTSTSFVQAAGAAFNDMGLSTSVFPDPGGTYDVSDDQFTQLVFFISTIAVPAAAARDATASHGRALFDTFGCSSCHMPTLVTGDSDISALAHQTIHPYTDVLLHDMGPQLSDNRPDYMAMGSQWRTTPLWGIGLALTVTDGVSFMHDGRARSLEEAIMWHGGEAQPAHDAFAAAVKADRDALVAFLNTL